MATLNDYNRSIDVDNNGFQALLHFSNLSPSLPCVVGIRYHTHTHTNIFMFRFRNNFIYSFESTTIFTENVLDITNGGFWTYFKHFTHFLQKPRNAIWIIYDQKRNAENGKWPYMDIWMMILKTLSQQTYSIFV